MKLEIIDEKEYKKFALNNPYMSIYQLPEWGLLKETNGWKPHLVGLYDNKTLKGVTLLLEKNTQIKKSLYYAPRGYLLDVFDYDLLSEFHKQVVDYVKKHKGFMLKVDPNVIYALHDSDGNLKENIGQKAFDNFIKLGFKHLGFNKNFETLQPRYLCRFKLSKNYEDTLNTFNKSCKKHILDSKTRGVQVNEIDESRIEDFTNVLKNTAQEKNFVMRPSSYYEKMYSLMKDYIKLYIVSVDTKKYVEYVIEELNDTKISLEELEIEMKKVNVGAKLERKKQELENKITNLSNELENAKNLNNEHDSIDIGALMSIFMGNEGITFMSGTVSKYKHLYPKYAYYNKHIEESLKEKKEYVNFYGISGDMNKDSEYYNIYEIKKGFNPEIVELLGEFDYIINKFDYMLYKLALKAYKVLKKR